jgi:putative flippase GtrA
LSGLLNTGLSYLLYLGLLEVFAFDIAYTGAFVLGILISYALNAKFVFRSNVDMYSLIRFSFFYLVQYFIGLSLLVLLVDYFGVLAHIAPFFAMVVTVPLTYVLSRSVFTKKKNGGGRVS